LLKPLQIKGFVRGGQATVSGTVSKPAIAKTICHHWLKFAETLPERAFKNAVAPGLVA